MNLKELILMTQRDEYLCYVVHNSAESSGEQNLYNEAWMPMSLWKRDSGEFNINNEKMAKYYKD